MPFQIHFHHCDSGLQQACRNVIDEWQQGCEWFTFHTSGSTGLPKQIKHHRKQISASATRTNDFFNLHETSRVLLCINPQHVGGKMVLIRAIVGNYEVHVVPVQRQFWESIQSFQFDFVSLVPLQVQAAIDTDPNILKQFNSILLGGSSLSPDLEKKLQLALDAEHQAFMGYGMTETISHIALRQVGEMDYTLLSGVSIKPFSDHTRIQDVVTGIEVTCSDVLETTIPNGFQWLGRSDFVINSGGIKIHPEVIEHAISDQITGVFAVSSIPDEILGEKLVLITETFLGETTRNQLETRINTKFGPYAVPKEYIVHSIPTNGTKILRRQLQEEIRTDQ